jgi:hypothetical protein
MNANEVSITLTKSAIKHILLTMNENKKTAFSVTVPILPTPDAGRGRVSGLDLEDAVIDNLHGLRNFPVS